MRIQQLQIRNFRSIRDLTLECHDMVALLGPNNHGKSNILSALGFALSTSVKPGEEDFFVHREDDELWVELTFAELTQQEDRTFQKYVRNDGTFTVRKTATLKEGKTETSYNGVLALPDEDWLQPENVAEYRSRDAIGATPLAEYIPETGRITNDIVQEAQRRYMDAHADELSFHERLESGPFLGQKNIGGGVLPDFFLIPAVRELTEEIKTKSTSMFGRLLTRAVKEMTARDQRFVRLRESLHELVGTLNERGQNDDEQTNELARLEESLADELGAWGAKVRIEVTPPEIEKIFELGTDLHLDDGIETTADRKGHGLQRALIFALLRSWAKALRQEPAAEAEVSSRQGSESVIFAMEEPELFLHPHAQKQLARSLRDIARTDQHQVLLCTHSTHFVDLDHYQDIGIVTKPTPEEGSTVRQFTGELFAGGDPVERKRRFHMAHWVNPDRAEIFFAQRVVLVEGETEKVVLPFLAEKLGCYNPEISIIDCGAKHNLEPPRDSRRLHFLRGWSDEHDEAVFPGGPGAGGPDGIRASGRVCLAVGGARFDCVQDRLHAGDPAQLGAPSRARPWSA